jgi:hypothetical protein
VAARNHIGLHAWLRAQHSSHVLGMRANDGGCGFIPMFGNPTASRHGNPGIGSFPLVPIPTSLFLRHKH